MQYLRSYRQKSLINSQNSKFVVAVTQRIDSYPARSELRDALDQRLILWLVHAGFLPVAVPNGLSDTQRFEGGDLKNWLEMIEPRALLLSGGNDIGEYPARDVTESYLLSWAASNRLPVLGICRGLQMIAVWAGVGLVKKEGHVGCRHSLTVFDQSNEWPVSVNSYHGWVLATCPNEFHISAQSEDGSIEAIKHSTLPFEGWMWHPEREETFSQHDVMRLKRLFRGQT